MTVAVNWDQLSVMSGVWGPNTSVQCDTAPLVIGNIFQTDWAADFSVAEELSPLAVSEEGFSRAAARGQAAVVQRTRYYRYYR